MGRPRIIFVDDEVNVLNALKRSLFSLRKTLDMVFENVPEKAVQKLKTEHFDIIATDMRMPKVDGSAILRVASELQPQALRIVISGYSEEETILKTVGLAHQFLAKPVSPEELKKVIKRGFAIKDIVENEDIRKLVGKLETIPSVPKVYNELVKALNSNKATPKMLAQIIMQDVGLSSKILQLVNSAFFGLLRKVRSIEEAVVFLGIDTIRSLVLGVNLFKTMQNVSINGFSLSKRIVHCLNVASLARQIVLKENLENVELDDVFLAGLVHDCGLVILIENFPDLYRKVLKLSEEKKLPLFKSEKYIFGVSHAEVGGYLLAMWGLPENIVRAVCFHHEPLKDCFNYINCTVVLHIADALVEKLDGDFSSSLNKEVIQKFSLQEKIKEFLGLLKGEDE